MVSSPPPKKKKVKMEGSKVDPMNCLMMAIAFFFRDMNLSTLLFLLLFQRVIIIVMVSYFILKSSIVNPSKQHMRHSFLAQKLNLDTHFTAIDFM